MAKIRKDVYVNVAFGNCIMSAANTLTFTQIQLAVGIFQGVAMLLHRINYFPTIGSVRELTAATDYLTMALTSSSQLTAINDVAEAAIIDSTSIIPVGVSVEPVQIPVIKNFGGFPGGGRLVPANPLYIAALTAGAAAASQVRCQLDFTFVELTDKDYIELIQSQLPANL